MRKYIYDNLIIIYMVVSLQFCLDINFLKWEFYVITIPISIMISIKEFKNEQNHSNDR